MAIALVQSAKTANAIASPLTASFTAVPIVGNLLVANVYTNVVGATSIPYFVSEAVYGIGATTTQFGFYGHAVAPSGFGFDVTATDTGAPSQYQFQVAEFSGVNATPNVSATVASSAVTVLTLDSPTIVTTVADCLLVSFFTANLSTAATSTNASAGWTQVPTNGNNRSAMAYQIVSSTGSYACTWTWATTSRASVGIVAYPIGTNTFPAAHNYPTFKVPNGMSRSEVAN